MASKRFGKNPAVNHRRKSVALVDTAEDLVDSLDNLAVCLKHIDERHSQSKDDKTAATDHSLYEKLRDNLEIARDLTDTLKREKWRLSRREMSIELRKDELEEYKSHLKRDMTDMNQTVDVLSVRIIQLENELCEAQETQESTNAEKAALAKQLEESKSLIKRLEAKQADMVKEIQTLKSQRKDKVLKYENVELNNEKEVLLIENQRLKELIREKEGIDLENAKRVTENGSMQPSPRALCTSCQHKLQVSSVPSSPTPTSPSDDKHKSEVAYV